MGARAASCIVSVHRMVCVGVPKASSSLRATLIMALEQTIMFTSARSCHSSPAVFGGAQDSEGTSSVESSQSNLHSNSARY
jgi:hypothetical protein